MYICLALIVLAIQCWNPGVLVTAQNTSGGPVTRTTTISYCKTSYSTSSRAHVPTGISRYREVTTITYSSAFNPIVKVSATTTYVTSTVREFVTATVTEPGTTGTLTSTSTVTRTDIWTTTIYPVYTFDGSVYQTGYTYTPTATVEHTPNITPITDTLPGVSQAQKRSLGRRGRIELQPRQNSSPASYPQKVECLVIIKRAVVVIVPVNLSSTVTWSTGGTVIVTTSTQTLTSPRTVYATTPSEIVTTTTTATFITTSAFISSPHTQYYSTPTTTVGTIKTIFSVCVGAGTVSGSTVKTYEPASPTGSNQYTISTVVDYSHMLESECCGRCAEDPTCAASYFETRPAYYRCELISRSNGICDAANPLLLRAVLSPTRRYLVSSRGFNNKCGRFVESRVDSA